MNLFKFIVIFMLFFAIQVLPQQFQNIAVTTNNKDQSEPNIAISPVNSDHLLAAWNDFRVINANTYYKPGYAFSTDGGQSWSDAVVVPPGFTNGFDPSVAFDQYGNAFYCYIASNIGLGPVYVSRTTDFGTNWTHKSVTALTSDKPFMAVDNSGGNNNGRIYVSWTDFSVGNAQQIRFAYSTNHGQTFSNFTILAQATGAPEEEYVRLLPESGQPEIPANFQENFVQASVPVVGPNGEVYVVWLNRVSSSIGYIKLRKSTNGGQSFGSPINVTPSGFEPVWIYTHGLADARTMPTIAVDPTNGYVYIAYISWSGGVTNIYFTRSTNGGVNWSSPVTVTQYTQNYQFFPWLTVDPSGYISLVYYHGYTQGSTKLIDVYVAESFDSGENFTGSDLKITDTPSSPSNASWTHHYIGIVSRLGGDIFPVWTDYRNGNADPYFSLANTLYHYAAQNKSVDHTATYSNSARNQVKGAGYLHEVFSSGGEIFYRRSSDDGEHFGIPERITTGIGNNQRACITCYNWTPSEIEFTTLAAVWERKINVYQYEVWYSSSDAQTINWSAPQKLADVIISSAQSGALPVVSSLEYQGDIQLVVVYCSREGLRYRLYFPSSSRWAIPEPEIIDGSDRVRFPSLSSSNSFLSLLYEIRGQDGVFSRKYTGASWTSSYHVADVTGTWYNRSPSITIDPENHPLAAWRGQIYEEETLDPHYSLLFRYGYSNNTWSDWYAIFEHPDEISLNVPSITYYKKTGISTYGIKIVYDNSINEIRLKEYDIGNLWDDILVTTGGRFPNMTEEDYTSGNPVYCWTDQDGPPYTVTNNTYCGLPCHGGNKVLAGLEKGQTSIQHPRTSFIHKRRGVVLDTLTGSSLILDIEPIVVQTSDGKEIILPFKPIAVHKPINLTATNYNGYLGNDTLTLPTNAANLVFKSHVSTPSGTDSSGITYNNLFAGNYSAVLQVINVLNPAASISTNITSNSIVNVNLQSLAGRQVIIKPTMTLNNLSGSRLKFGVGDIYSPVQSAPKENLTGFESATIIPNRIRLENNYPNPFNPVTIIRFSLPEYQQVKLTIYTIIGERIATLVSGFLESGEHRIEWNGTNQAGTPVASGIYLYELKAGNERLVKKMLLAR